MAGWRELVNWLYRLFNRKFDENASSSIAIGVDLPIRNAEQDLLGRTTLAQRIAEIASQPTGGEGRVVAIRGGWGFGKSSLKNLVIEALGGRSPRTDYVDFNPWQWGDNDAITRALFSQIAARLGGAHSPDAEQRAQALRRYGDVLIGGGGALGKAADDKGLVGWVGSVAAVSAGVGIGFPSLPVKVIAAAALVFAGLMLPAGKLLKWLGGDASGQTLDQIRGDLERRLKALSLPLVIFVDDIDRLEAEQIRVLFRQIKVNANLPNIVFILLYQPSIVEKALEPVAGSEGRQYLEKIIQSHIDLPPVSRERLAGIFAAELTKVAGDLATRENGFEERRWGNVSIGGIQPFIRNLRDVARLVASIDIHKPLHQGRRVFEVNVVDFLALEALRVFEPNFHTGLAANKELLLQSRRFRGDRGDDADKVAVEQLLHAASEAGRGACSAILVELFPSVHWTLGGPHYVGDEMHRDWLVYKRVCSSRNFDRYFELKVPEGSLSESDMVDLLDSADNPASLKTAIDGVRERGLLGALAARLDESVDQLPIEHAANLLPVIFAIGEELSQEPDADGPFNTSFVSAWRSASWFLRRLPDLHERSRLALNAMAATLSLATPAVLISIDTEKDESSDLERLFDDVGLQELQRGWLTIMATRAENDPNILEHDRLVNYLYRWRDYSGSIDAPKAWIEKVASDPQRLPKLLVRFLSVGRKSAWGDRVSTKSETYRRDTMTDFFDLEQLRERLGGIDRGRLDSETIRILSILDNYLDAWQRGEAIPDD